MWFDEFFPKTKIKPFNTFYSRKHFKINLFISLQRLSSPKLYHNRLLLANWLNSITPHSVEKQEINSHLQIFRENNLQCNVVISTLISRKFCEKQRISQVRVNFSFFHTVHQGWPHVLLFLVHQWWKSWTIDPKKRRRTSMDTPDVTGLGYCQRLGLPSFKGNVS